MIPETSPSRGSIAILRVVLYYAGFSAVWILLSDRLVVMVAASADQITTLSTIKGWFFVGVTSLLLYRMMKRVLRPEPSRERRTRVRRFVPPVLILGLVILALAWGGIHQVYRQLELTEAARLQAVADSKALQVSEWVQERRGDVAFASSSRFWSKAYYAWRKSGNAAERARLFGNLETYRDLKGFQVLRVFDDQLTAQTFPPQPSQAPELLEAVKAAMGDRVSRVVGPYRDPGGALRLDFLAPMAPDGDRPGPILVLTVDPASQLYPRFQVWPVPTATGEVVLFRRLGDKVQYLSGSPQNPDGQIQMTQPLEGSELLTAQALRGTAPLGSFIKGKDYNGGLVAGVVQPVRGTDWFLVAKVDQSELYAAGRNQVAVIGLAALLAIFITVLVDRMFRQQRILVQAERDKGLQAERIRALRLLDGIATASSDAIYAKDRAGRYLLFNPEAERAFGMKAADILGKEAQGPGAHEEDSAILLRGSARTLEEVLATPQGPRTFLVTKGPLRDDQGGIMGHYGIAKDITERKLKEQALQDSWLRFRQLFEAAPVPMCILGEGGLMVALNGQFSRTFGFTLEDIGSLAQWLERAWPDPASREQARAWLEARAAAGPGAAPFEATLACLDGEARTVLLSATAIGGEFLLTLSDITERVKAERERQALQAEIQQSQKMESIGRLAGGVAHDFNNMLGVIVANAEVGMLHSAPGKAMDRFEEIKKAAMRSAELTRQLLAFARKQTVSPTVIDLNQAIPGMLQMLSRLIGENITLDYAQRDGLWPVRMDATQVDQILANLAVNARDAIAGVGRMTIHTENRVVRPGEAPPAHPGDFVVLEVSDDGRGMDAEVLSHIFEPFFTTKAVGKGTGLGLATVYGIVKHSGGFIEVRSAPGQGTTFRVHLPRHEGPVEKLPGADAEAPSRGGRECVLVVEDEPMHLDVTVMLLGSLGYRTLAAASPSEALAFLAQPELDIGLLLTDVIMPEMNGRELAERARKMRPGLRCLLMSGYTADIMEHHGVMEGELKVMGKPFSLQDLAREVRAAMDS
ncbi:PAS domain S-box protein [Mesoterricola silvestris]|uniref:histidine kinase n=1 Tax=Mesoterricola silvestris TaxID=2927979 RepID=A0AA48GR86_9BACT|nr:PAS domain S-box protein [Mesoterricola silvestris]BDU74230.1 hypothetical protein METEAL_34040 [Mesoterricola silvestris]